MEAVLSQILQSGNATAIICFIICYVVIYFQRKNTGTNRDNAQKALEDEIRQLRMENELMKKDVKNLKEEHCDIKEDVKEIKNTLQNMALALERLAASIEIAKGTKNV
jgi:septal ring factor EnvC (AmiA/AmiB activator)